MKRKILIWMLITCMLFLTACNNAHNGKLKGEVVFYGGEPLMFELLCDHGQNFGFLINEDTEVVWEDKSALSVWENTNVEYDDWDVFDDGMLVTVVPGDKALSEEADREARIEGWFFAKKIIVTDSSGK